MDVIHAALAVAALASAAILLVIAVVTMLGTSGSYRALDIALLAQLAVTALTALAGVATYASVRPPGDALHVLYGAVATLAPAGARAAAHGGPVRRLARWMTVAALVAVGASVRSFMTGN